MLWLDIARICAAGALLGAIVGKLVARRPYYLERLHPRFWLSVTKGMRGRDWLRVLGIAFGIAIFAFLIIGWVSYGIVDRIGWELYSEEEFVFARLEEISPLALLLIVNVLPVFEEWVFRGILLEEAARRARSRLLGLLISAFVFALFHLSNPGTYPAYAIPLALGGILLGACYLLIGLGGAIVSHCAYNSLLLLLGA